MANRSDNDLTHADRVQACLDTFESHLTSGPAPLSRRYDGGRHGLRVVFGSMVHGNEVGSLPGIVDVMAAIEAGSVDFGGVLDVFVGNAPAGLANRRMLEADLNRVFTPSMPDSAERRRAIELEPILTGCDLFVDFHQTLQPTAKPFFTLPWLAQEAHWVRAMGGGEAWITRKAGTPFDAGTCCTDEFVRNQGLPGLTLELGYRGFDEGARALTATTIIKVLQILDQVAEQGPDALSAAASKAPEVPLYVLTHSEPYAQRAQQLKPGVRNFQPVTRGENLAAPGSPDLITPTSGVLMFPKSPPADEPLPASIYRIAERLEEDPAVVWA